MAPPRRHRPPRRVRALLAALAGARGAGALRWGGPESSCPEHLRGARFLLVNNVCEQIGSGRASVLQLMKLAAATDRVFVPPFVTSTPHTLVATDCGPACGGAAADDYFPFSDVWELKHRRAVVPGLRNASFEEWRRCTGGFVDAVVAFPFKDEDPLPEGSPAVPCSPYMRGKIDSDLGSAVSAGSRSLDRRRRLEERLPMPPLRCSSRPERSTSYRTCMPRRFGAAQLYSDIVDAGARSLLMYQWSKLQECSQSRPCTSRLRLGLIDRENDVRGIARTLNVTGVDVDKEFKFRRSSPAMQSLMSQVLGAGCGPGAAKVLLHVRVEKLARRFGREAAAQCAPREAAEALAQLREKLAQRGEERELCTLVATDMGADGSVTFVDVGMADASKEELERTLLQAVDGRPLLPGRTTIQAALGTLALAAWADAYADVGQGSFGQTLGAIHRYSHARPAQVRRSGNATCGPLAREGGGEAESE